MTATSLADLVANPYAKKKYLVTVKPYDVANTTRLTLYYSGEGFVSGPSDSPANTLFDARLVEPISFSRSMFSSGKVGGFSAPGFGQLVLTNADGGLDDWAGYAWDGAEVIVKVGEAGAALQYYFTIFTGQAKSIEFDDLSVSVVLRDQQATFDVDFPSALYAGSGGVEGSANLTGAPKPLCFGQVYNIEPVLVDATNRIYQVHTGQIEAINTVYQGGVALATSAYSVDLTNGRFTLDSAPDDVITADAQGAKPGGSYKSTVADIINHIVVTHTALASGDLVSATFSALNTANSSVVGIYVATSTTILDVLDQLINTVGGFYGFNREGKFEVGQIILATGTAAAEFDASTIIEITRLAPAVPNYQARVEYKHNYRTFSEAEFGDSVTTAQRDYLMRPALVAVSTDTAIQTPYPNSDPLIVPSLFSTSANAATEAARLLTLYKTQREIYRILVKSQPYTLKLNDVVKVTFGRYNLASGKLFRLVGIVETAATNEIELELWG